MTSNNLARERRVQSMPSLRVWEAIPWEERTGRAERQPVNLEQLAPLPGDAT